jgi:ADP-ribosylarginine hydrolase
MSNKSRKKEKVTKGKVNDDINDDSNEKPKVSTEKNKTKPFSKNIKERFLTVMLLHALGDTIGFKNGDWEFNYYDKEKFEALDYVNELIYEFIDLGGVNGIDLTDWKVSDDTFFHIAMANALTYYNEEDGVSEKLILKVKECFLQEYERIEKEVKGTYKDEEGKKVKFDRYIGITTLQSISNFTKDHDARNTPYNDFAGGNGCAMRTLIIGACFYGEENRDTLIELSVKSSWITHNNAIGYLAGFNAALFTALAFENVPLKDWPYILIKYLKSNELKTFLSLNNLDQIYDHNLYIKYWQKYLDTKFDKDGNPLKIRANSNPMHRIRYYHDNFFRETESIQIGASGYLCMIMAFDSLLDCDGCWEKLIVYAMLHSGDSDTIGAVAGGLYGAVYGFGDVPVQMLKHIERKKEIEDLVSVLYKKFIG